MDGLQKMVGFTGNCRFGMLDIIFQNLAEKGEKRGKNFPINGIKICPSERLYSARFKYSYIIII